jgi:hypothetical protein
VKKNPVYNDGTSYVCLLTPTWLDNLLALGKLTVELKKPRDAKKGSTSTSVEVKLNGIGVVFKTIAPLEAFGHYEDNEFISNGFALKQNEGGSGSRLQGRFFIDNANEWVALGVRTVNAWIVSECRKYAAANAALHGGLDFEKLCCPVRAPYSRKEKKTGRESIFLAVSAGKGSRGVTPRLSMITIALADSAGLENMRYVDHLENDTPAAREKALAKYDPKDAKNVVFMNNAGIDELLMSKKPYSAIVGFEAGYFMETQSGTTLVLQISDILVCPPTPPNAARRFGAMRASPSPEPEDDAQAPSSKQPVPEDAEMSSAKRTHTHTEDAAGAGSAAAVADEYDDADFDDA